jgi:MFS family permease
MMLTSLCKDYYQFLLCQGILLGMSCGLVFAPALSVVGQYFMRRRALAMSLASTGSPLGGLIFPIILKELIPAIGFPWAQRVCGFVSLFVLGIAAVLLRPTGMRRQGKVFLLEAFKKPAYILQVAALFMVVLGLWTPYFYIADYALDHHVSPNIAGYLLSLVNAGSFIGRFAAGYLAGWFGQYNVITFACYASSILLFSWLAITSSAGLIILAILFGATSGIIIALMMSTLAHCADHPSKVSL